MIEPPSKQLVETLLTLKLCGPADIRRCRHRVRQLARDLPAFDSVWIDALLKARRLTPFQAQLLESSHPEDLRVGPCVLVEQLGHGPLATTYLARQRDSHERNVLKLIDLPPERMDSALQQLEQLIARWVGFAHPHVVPPQGALIWNNRLVAVSRYLPGPHLGELLVRRGRFPAAVVLEISKQLIDGLAALESRGSVHGDIRLRNVRLTSEGTAVLVDSGIGPVVTPELTIRADRSPERYDGVAPELIGTGNRSDSASDIYALGCLLWQLLAGRPPFPTGDPLAKLAAHRTRDVADVREWAPDTPPELAQAIGMFTEQNRSRRPQSFRTIRDRWKPPKRSGRRKLARFAGYFRTAAQHKPMVSSDPSSTRWAMLLILMFVFSGAALSLLDEGARHSMLDIGHKAVQWVKHPVSAARESLDNDDDNKNGDNKNDRDKNHGDRVAKKTGTARSRFRPLPLPDASGLIRLDGNAPYAWERIDTVGPLVIRGTPGQRPVIMIEQTPCRFVAEQVTLENIRFQRIDSAAEATSSGGVAPKPPLALVEIQARSVIVRGCQFRGQRTNDTSTLQTTTLQTEKVRPAAIVWKRLDPADRDGGKLVLQDTLFAGDGTAVAMTHPAEQIDVRNCLKLGRGAFFDLRRAPRSGRILRATISHLTLRRAETLLRMVLPDRPNRVGIVHIDATDSVFDLARTQSALFQLVAIRSPGKKVSAVELFADRCVAPSSLLPAVWIPLDRPASSIPARPTRMTALPPFSVEIDGLTARPYRFAGPFSWRPSDSQVVPDRNEPTRSGADTRRLR